MFNTPSTPSASIEEGSVTEIDIHRKVCKVKTLSGQNLTNVSYPLPSGGSTRAGDRITPVLGDRVLVDSSTGSPMISTFMPRLQTNTNSSVFIDTGELLIDTGNFSSAGKNVVGDQGSPKDMVIGDRIITSPGGGMVSLLRAGSILIRSSRMSEIFLNKLMDLVRISSRNFEHFTDVSSNVVRNIKGRIYRYAGYSKKIQDAKVESYTYNQYYGDVVLAEAFKTDYNKSDTLPAPTDIIFKEQILDRVTSQSPELMKRELFLNGNENIVIKSGDGSIFTHQFSTKDEIIITYNDINVIKINTDEISFRKNGDPRSIVIKQESIVSTLSDATVTMDLSGITSVYKGGTVKMNDSSVTTTFGGAVHKVSDNGVESTKGGHFMKVTSGGVAFG